MARKHKPKGKGKQQKREEFIQEFPGMFHKQDVMDKFGCKPNQTREEIRDYEQDLSNTSVTGFDQAQVTFPFKNSGRHTNDATATMARAFVRFRIRDNWTTEADQYLWRVQVLKGRLDLTAKDKGILIQLERDLDELLEFLVHAPSWERKKSGLIVRKAA